MRIIIGSTAALERGVPIKRKSVKDVDTFSNEPLPGDDSFFHPLLLDYFKDTDNRFATVDELTTIKYSHAFWALKNGSWGKHMADLEVLKAFGGKVIEPLFEILYAIWEEEHGAKIISLAQEEEDFFNKNIKRVYVHDSIHESVAYPNRPVYESCLKDGKSVELDMKKVWGMDKSLQLKMFEEEICTIALERILIPRDYNHSPGGAYQWALCRTITSLTKGKSARFIVDNFSHFKKPVKDYLDNHLAAKHVLVVPTRI